MRATKIEQARFEPTVVGAIRRYRLMVLAIAVLTAAAAVGYSLMQAEVYRAYATVTVPQSTFAQGEARTQYFDSQVLLLQSQEVAERAARIANAALNDNVLTREDFSGEHTALEITPPEQATPGGFGSSIVALTFTWPNPKVAQAGANAVLQAFDDVRSAAIAARGAAEVAAVDRAIKDTRTRGQTADLLNQRTKMLTDLQLDLASHPTFSWAVEPRVPVNGNSKRSGAIGLLAGLVLGAGLAYWRASRRRCIDDRLDPVAIYEAPLIGDIPSPRRSSVLAGLSAAGALPMAVNPQSQAAEAFRFTAGSVERLCAAHGGELALVFVSATNGAERSSVVANVALALAESGRPVLAVDADTTTRTLSGLLLPGSPEADGFEQVVSGSRLVSDCIEPSPLNADVTVLRAGPSRVRRTTGAAYAEAVERLITEAKKSFDLVLIDSPAVLKVANAVELTQCSDATVVVLGAGDPVEDHVAMVERLEQVEPNLVGYVFRRTGRKARFIRTLRDWIVARATRQTGPQAHPSAELLAFRRPPKERRTSAGAPRG
ncbi:Wzz/FepE/Etk N-terminal domain-containing protein [Kribbella sp. NPDC050124]|uniref:Wzz/FepE/Etk N-terminal domain-containing protein n=1 Tax=Kribbella sp. NPDC050124 TaxID=3364114 RepID=UPI0037B4DCFD